ncbi:MAG TPA: hypothetical protein VF232_01795 [Gaiellaceae bacterium]
MAAHLIIDRPHHGPRLLQSCETREEAEAARDAFISQHRELERATYIVVTGRSHATSRNVGGYANLGA